MKSQNGFGVVVLLVIVIVVSVVGFIGYRVYDNNASSDTTQTVSESSQDINSSQDITSTQNELDSINLEEDLDPSVLDEDVNDLQ
jgi:hypothetical protein